MTKKVCILTSRNVGQECIKWAKSNKKKKKKKKKKIGFVLISTQELFLNIGALECLVGRL